MQISICMMVKNEEENIRRCLNSVKAILQNIESELIIVDTGSQDNTVQIAKEYTDKIFFHGWENDFSGMRNKSISYAKGDWILIIDADEEIIDCNNIIKFLKSPKSKPFKTGLLSVKNLENLSDESYYAMIKSPRLFRNDGEFHYEGIVHNNPIFKEPTIDLETIILHYGYIEENEEIANKKFIRTSTLLKKVLEKEPDSIYYIFQLSVTYRSHKDYFNAYETIKKAYKLLNICKDKNRYKYVYYQMALCSIDLQEYEFAKKVCKEGLKVDREYIDLMFYLGKAQGLTGEYEEAIRTYKKYISLCDNYDKMNINFDISLGMYTLGQKDEALQDIVKLYFKMGKFPEVLSFASKIEKDKYLQNVLELIIKSAINLKNINYIKNFYQEKIEGDKVKEDNFFITLGKQYNDDIYNFFDSYDNEYSKLYFLRYKYNKNDSHFQYMIDEFIFEGDFNTLENCFGDIIYYKLKYCSSISSLFKSVWDKNINRYLQYILKNYGDFSEVVAKYINYFKKDMYYDSLRINKILCRYVLLVDKVDDSVYREIFKYYLDIGTKWIKHVYKSNLISGEYVSNFNDEEEKFLVYMSIAMKNKEHKETYIKYLRNALEVYPYMKKGIEILKNELLNSEKVKDTEFEEYKVQVKSIIRNYVENGNLIEVKEVIKEYEEVVKDDTEIYSIKAVLAIMEGDLETAEVILNVGLKIDNNNFDLLYNLAYVYEQKGEYNKALIYYKRARKIKYYESTIKIEIDKIIEKILKNNKDILKKECETNQTYRYLNKIENVLFIDFNLTKEVNNLGKNLDEYGINVDLAYSGVSPDSKFSDRNLPYRKLLGITNIDHLVEYINYYCYDVVHMFNVPDDIGLYIRERGNPAVVFYNELVNIEVNSVLNHYSEVKKLKKEYKNEVDINELTVIIPTYNRPKYLERVLNYFNEFSTINPYIIVLDSSFKENKKINERIVKHINNKKILYYKFDSKVHFLTKLNFGIQKVKTSYVALCPDDDFFTEEGLLNSVKALEGDQKLYSVKGKNIYFVEKMSTLKEYDFFEGSYEEKAIDRLINITKGFVPSFMYQVYRTDKFKNIYSFIELNIAELPENPTITEYLYYFMVICTGKIGKINVDLNIRDKGAPRESELKNFPHAIIEGTFNDDYIKFFGFLSKYIETIGQDKQIFQKYFPQIFSQFLINFLCVPKENVILHGNKFDMKQLEIGMKKSWVWPKAL